jgi:hypothetical protein
VIVPATFPYHEGFEAGTLGDEWLTDFTNEGRVQVADSYPYSGTYSLLLDDYRDDSIYSRAAAILTIDLSGQPDVMLDFWWREFSDTTHAEDGVFISDDDGTTWHPVLSLEGTSAWQREVIDLDAEAASAGIAFNDHFQIKFQFYEDDPIPVDGFAIDEVQVRPNAPPVLTWPGDTDYEQDGLDPESGDIRDTYVYRIKYADADGDPPALVQVHVDKGGTGIVGSPFTMDCAPGDYAHGVICSHTQEGLEEGSDYTYSFAGQDDQGNQAQSTPVLDAPDVTVTYWVYLPLVLRNAGPPAGPPHLDPIDNPSGHYSYTLTWSTVERATRYTLEEDDNPSFSSPEVVYSGSNTSASVVVQATGTYYYHVKASNKFGETGWSNTRSTVVTVAPPPCPQPGYWAGFTDQGYAVNYDLADTPDCEVTRLKITARLDCVMNPVDLEYTVEYEFPAPVVAREFEYYVSWGDYSERVSGTFTSQTEATGRWFFFVPDPNSPVPGRFCTGGGSWTATYRP